MSGLGTPTLLRVKRLRTADPSEMIVVKAKKRRAEEDGEENIPGEILPRVKVLIPRASMVVE